MEDRLIFRYHLDRANAESELLRKTLQLGGSTDPLDTRQAKGGRRRVGRPRRWSSWGKGVGRSRRQIRGTAFLRLDAEPFQAKRSIPSCQENPLASHRGARTPNRLRWAGREYQGDRENPG
jgi:hypothetical protein